MNKNKHELHPDLQDASLEKACEMANALVWHNDARRHPRASRIDPGQLAFDLHYKLEYIRLNFDLVPKRVVAPHADPTWIFVQPMDELLRELTR